MNFRKFSMLSFIILFLGSTSSGAANLQDFELQINSAVPGDEIIIPDGRYSGQLEIMANGNVTHPIIISGTSENTILKAITIEGSNLIIKNLVIKGKYADETPLINIRNAQNITLQNLSVQDGAGPGIKIENNSSYIKILNSEIHDFDALERWYWNAYGYLFLGLVAFALFFAQVHWIKSKRIAEKSKFSLVLMVIVSMALVYPSLSTNPKGYPISYHTGLDSHGIAIKAGSSFIFVENNSIYQCSGDSIQILNPPSASIPVVQWVWIQNNHLYGNRENALDIKDADYVFIINNTMEGARISPTFDSGRIMTLHLSTQHIEITHNRFAHGITGVSISFTSTSGYSRNIRSWNISVNNNEFYDLQPPKFFSTKSSAIFLRGVENVSIVDNVFDNSVSKFNITEGYLENIEWINNIRSMVKESPIPPMYPQKEEYLMVIGEGLMLYCAIGLIIVYFAYIIRRKNN